MLVMAGIVGALVMMSDGDSGSRATGSSNPTNTSVSSAIDDSPPTIAVTEPADQTQTSVSPLRFAGVVEVGAAVNAGDVIVPVSASGKWSVELPLNPGENTIFFTAHDPEGNKAQAGITVIYLPPVGGEGSSNPVAGGAASPTGNSPSATSPPVGGGGGAPTTSTGSYSAVYRGVPENWTVPTGVTAVTVDATGAGGGSGDSGGSGGDAGRMKCDIAVSPGEVLVLSIGERGHDGGPGGGSGGFNGGGNADSYGGGGGGATDVRRAGSSISNRVVVAGGGGGAGANGATGHGGSGGGGNGFSGSTGEFDGGGGGGPGTGAVAGSGGSSNVDKGDTGGYGSGGAGGADGGIGRGGGAGGGGTFGGGGGGAGSIAEQGGGGGGGSGLCIGSVVSVSAGVPASNGQITLAWTAVTYGISSLPGSEGPLGVPNPSDFGGLNEHSSFALSLAAVFALSFSTNRRRKLSF